MGLLDKINKVAETYTEQLFNKSEELGKELSKSTEPFADRFYNSYRDARKQIQNYSEELAQRVVDKVNTEPYRYPILKVVSDNTVFSSDKKWEVLDNEGQLIYVVHRHTMEHEYDTDSFYITDSEGKTVVNIERYLTRYSVWINGENYSLKKKHGTFINPEYGWLSTPTEVVHNDTVVGEIQKTKSITKSTITVKYDQGENPLWILLLTMMHEK